ncbi:MAG: NAD-dependent epimerase/dehydratase family protein [Verrucomicrobiota bacterium]
MKALVTGGGGFLGQAIVRSLRRRGTEVRSFSRQHYPELDALGVEQYQGNLTDAPAVAKAVAGCDVVFHVAAKAGIWGPYEDYHQINVVGTQQVIAACRQHGVNRLVYTSSPSVVFDGKDMEGVDESVPYPSHFEAHYPKTKAQAEQLIKAANDARLATVALRPHLIWGPGDNHLLPRIVARAKAGQLRRIGRARKLIDTIHVDNAADAHLLAAERLSPGKTVAGKAYFISQDQPIEIWEMINRLLDAAGQPPIQRTVPKSVAMLLAWCFETANRMAHSPNEPRLTRFVVRELSSAHWFNISAAKRDLGYRPAISIEEGLRQLKAHTQNESSV